MNKKILMIIPGLCLASCSLLSPTVTAPAFECISIGSPITEIETQIGPPYDVTCSQTGEQYYRYIERIQTGPNMNSQNTYILTIKEGKVIDKQCSNERQFLNLQIR